MHRFPFVMAVAAAAALAQDHVFPLGFGGAQGPPTTSHPLARVKDNDLDGFCGLNEIWAFGTTLPTTAPSGVNFMTDGRAVVEDGEYAFYFTDSEDGQVIRGVDRNHNGVLDPNEVNVFFRFGLAQNGTAALFAPDTLAVHRDPVTNRTRVYVALDNSNPSSLGFTRGIHRLVDLNGDGDAMDPGEQSLFVSGSMGLTVPGNSGPVTISRDFWRTLRVLPGGKLLAFAQGARLTGTGTPPVYTIQPDMNCWYGFTDNNGTAVPEVWFNASRLNNLPQHPDFANGVYPNWDIEEIGSPRRANYARFCDVVPNGGPGGAHVYYLASSYRTGNEGDLNLNGQPVSGLVYRVVDSNGNQTIDPGELSLFCNLSGQVYGPGGGVAPVSFVNAQNNLVVTNLVNSTWGFSTSSDGRVHFLYENGGTHDGLVTMEDQNGNGVIDQGEIWMPYYTPTGPGGYLPPFNQQLGPYFGSLLSLADATLPGPFYPGIVPVGDGCIAPLRRLKVLMDSWHGAPQIGNRNFTVGSIRGLPMVGHFFVADFAPAPGPASLAAFGFAPGCNSHLLNPVTVGFGLSDNLGRAMLNVPLPNNPVLVTASLTFQIAAYDPTGTALVPYYTTNALQVTVQP